VIYAKWVQKARPCFPVLTAYQQLFTCQQTGQNLWHHLHAQNQLGVTKGTLYQ
jgi:hypothetical protein